MLYKIEIFVSIFSKNLPLHYSSLIPSQIHKVILQKMEGKSIVGEKKERNVKEYLKT